MFGVNGFYPSIKEKLLWEAIRFAKRHISVTSKDIEAIFQARKSLLYYNDEPWSKKEKAALMLQWAHTMGLRYVN